MTVNGAVNGLSMILLLIVCNAKALVMFSALTLLIWQNGHQEGYPAVEQVTSPVQRFPGRNVVHLIVCVRYYSGRKCFIITTRSYTSLQMNVTSL